LLVNGRRAQLAFDHRKILTDALQRLRRRIDEAPIVFVVMPEQFTLAQLQSAFETIKGEELDKRNFRKWVIDKDWLKETGEFQRGRQRPAVLFTVGKKISKLYAQGQK